ncbi:MAG: group 1 truncated hemoglobin [Alphaproteobacteria bacterium]
MTSPPASLFEQIGGAPAVQSLLLNLYRRMAADETLSPVFSGLNFQNLHGHMQKFLTVAFGGPGEYAGRSLTQAHAGMVGKGTLDARVFAQVMRHTHRVLNEDLHLAPELTHRVMNVLGAMRGEVLGETPPNPVRPEPDLTACPISKPDAI